MVTYSNIQEQLKQLVYDFKSLEQEHKLICKSIIEQLIDELCLYMNSGDKNVFLLNDVTRKQIEKYNVAPNDDGSVEDGCFRGNQCEIELLLIFHENPFIGYIFTITIVRDINSESKQDYSIFFNGTLQGSVSQPDKDNPFPYENEKTQIVESIINNSLNVIHRLIQETNSNDLSCNIADLHKGKLFAYRSYES